MSKNPITTVRASGSPFSIGHELGRAGATALVERVFATEEYRALEARWRGTDYLRQLEAAARAAYPRYVREIEGIAAGSGQDFETLFLWNCRGDVRLPERVSTATADVSAAGCTTIQIPARDGHAAVIAHNEDGACELLGVCLWVEVEPDDEPAWQSFMYPGMLPGHTFGVNAAGLVQTINNIRAHDLKPGIPRQIVCRAVLGSRDMDAALDVLCRTDRASGFHHNLGEAGSQRLASVEAPASGCEVRMPAAPIAHANHLIADAFRDLDQTVTQSSRNRQDAADSMIAGGALSQGGAELILFEETTPIHCDRDRRDDYAQTLATGIFELHTDRVDWTVHAAPDERAVLGGSVAVG